MTLRTQRWVIGFAVAGFIATTVYLSPLFFKALHIAKPFSQRCSNALVVYAHADDELSNAGLIRTLANRGTEISLLILTDGAANQESDLTFCDENESITVCRTREMRHSAKLMGVKHLIFANLPDSRLSESVDKAADAVTNIINNSRPDCLVLMEASGLNGSADHRAAHQAVRQAFEATEDNPLVFLSTLPWPLRFVLPSELPDNRTDRIHILELDEKLIQAKVDVGNAHKSQWRTIQNITLRLGPAKLFQWIDFETYSIHTAQEIFRPSER